MGIHTNRIAKSAAHGPAGGFRVDRRKGEHDLQAQLRDLVSLAVVGDHVRWVSRRDEKLGGWLTEAARQWRRWADQVATQLGRAGVAPDGRVRSLARDIPLNWVPDGWLASGEARRLVAERIETVDRWTRYRLSQARGTDAELLELISIGLEAQLDDLPGATAPSRRSRG
jgi:hypothetical protein